jgi:hypothetical protein
MTAGPREEVRPVRSIGGSAARQLRGAAAAQGLITRRLDVPAQDLSRGLLVCRRVPGRVEAVLFEAGRGATTPAANALAQQAGEILDLRALEQTVENLARLSSQSARFVIEPGIGAGLGRRAAGAVGSARPVAWAATPRPAARSSCSPSAHRAPAARTSSAGSAPAVRTSIAGHRQSRGDCAATRWLMVPSMTAHRPSYIELRRRVLDTYHEACRRLGPQGRPRGELLGYVAYQYEGCLDSPVEQLMFDVILLMLSGTWHEEASGRLRADLVQRCRRADLVAAMAELEPPDRIALASDLAALGHGLGNVRG